MKRIKYLLLSFFSISMFWACGSNNNSIEAYKSKESNAASAAEQLFTSKCSMCHSLQEDKIGPSLAGASQRWGADRTKLKSFIKNAQAYIKTGDPYAAKLYEKWNRSNMPVFEQLSDDELNALIEYIK